MSEILVLIAAVFIGLSVAIQKYAFQAEKRFTLRAMLTNKIWLFSMLVGLFGLVLYIEALNTVALSTAQPLSAMYLLIPIAIGALKFKEEVGVKKWLLIGLLIIGMVLISV